MSIIISHDRIVNGIKTFPRKFHEGLWVLIENIRGILRYHFQTSDLRME